MRDINFTDLANKGNELVENFTTATHKLEDKIDEYVATKKVKKVKKRLAEVDKMKDAIDNMEED